jgi:hypothetical protein
MIQHADHLDIMPVGQRQDPVASAEPWMESAIEKPHPQLRSEPLRRSLQAFRPGRERQVIQVHVHIVAGGLLRRAGGLIPALMPGLWCRIGRMQHCLAASGLERPTHLDKDLVRRRAHERDQLGAILLIHRTNALMRLSV